MALAILELLGWEGSALRFRIDTGTNRFYQLKIGRGQSRRFGIDWAEDVYRVTPLQTNEMGGGLLQTAKDIRLPVGWLEKGNAYVQLFSYKTVQGRSPAYSNVVEIPGAGVPVPGSRRAAGQVFSMGAAMITAEAFEVPRAVPCRTAEEVYSQPASIGDLLNSIVKVAAPLLNRLIAGAQPAAAPASAEPKEGSPSATASTRTDKTAAAGGRT